ncbi:MAG: hypothetical protein LBQ50_03155 [Planctomycetaceae bacterium]|nr:hypothetical protein [Planctomycetaceae bacterium]
MSDPIENKTPSPVPLPSNTETTPTGGSSIEFFDRERWHDVESENSIRQDEPVPQNKVLWSLFSIGVLLFVVVIAGALGIVTAYYLSSLMQTPAIPEPDYRSVPPQWIGYVEDSVFFCEVNDPLCFSGDGNGKFYIGDSNPPSIREFSIKTKLVRTIPLQWKPMAIAIGGSDQLFAGQLLVAHPDRLAVYSMNGELRFSWSVPDAKSAIWSLAITDHAVFAADTGQCVVYQFDEKGTILKTLGQPLVKKTKPDSLSDPSDLELMETFPGFSVYFSPITLTVSRKTGLIHVANPGQHRIETFTPDGYWEPSLSWGNASGDLAGFVGCCNPVSISTLADGRIVTAEKFVTRVKVFYAQLQKGTGRRLDCVVAGPEVLDKPPSNIPQLALFRLPPSETGRPIFVTTLGNDIIVFDPVMRVIRYFTALATPKEDHESPE